MLRSCGLFLLLSLCCTRLFALEASVMHTVFYRADPARSGKLQPYVETSWQVNPRTIHYITTPDKKIAGRMMTDVYFIDEKGTVVHEEHFILQTPRRNTPEELATINIIGVRKFNVPPGFIKATFKLTDLADSTNRASYTDTFTVAGQPGGPFFSNLQLLDTMLESADQTDFTKNGRQQIPASANFLNDHKRMLHYYGELYTADQVAADELPLIRRVYITKKRDEAPAGRFVKTDTITAASLVPFSGSFHIGALVSGNYYLKAILENSGRKVLTSQTLFFQRFNSRPQQDDSAAAKAAAAAANDTAMERVTVLDLNKTFIAKYTLGQVRAILKMLIPISDAAAVQTIQGFLAKPDETYMRYYIYNRFAAINKDDPGKAWKEFSERIKEVNKKFTHNSTPGYETERGFTYLRYGAPTEVVTVSNEKGSLPYEVWQYNVLTQRNGKNIPNAVFLFYKTDQLMSDYRMLHSTVSGEITNMSWRGYLYNGAEGGMNANSRAEQYIGNR